MSLYDDYLSAIDAQDDCWAVYASLIDEYLADTSEVLDDLKVLDETNFVSTFVKRARNERTYQSVLAARETYIRSAAHRARAFDAWWKECQV